MQRIKMIAADLDGTLLYSPSKITDYTKEVIRKAREQGIKFGICSGRPIEGLKRKVKDWGIEDDVDFILGFNGGALYKDGKKEEWLQLPAGDIKSIIDGFEGQGLTFAEYTDGKLETTNINPLTSRMAARNSLDIEKVDINNLEKDTSKLMAIGMPWQISKALNKIKEKTADSCRMFRSGPFLIEIVHPKLSKLEGVKHVAGLYNIPLSEVMTFGNDNNDVEMLAGTVGVAMANGLDSVKNAASYIALSNRKDGVAEFIDKNILQPEHIHHEKSRLQKEQIVKDINVKSEAPEETEEIKNTEDKEQPETVNKTEETDHEQ